ncbi:MAG TPA: hypothetical protein HPP80_10905 [Rhodospirillaceae bacterium]|nr:hypothetical protein [Rhodospirillaceae bacterium]
MSNLAYGVQYATRDSADSIEEWLSEHCAGDWDLRLADIDEKNSRKKFAVYFERETDKAAFKAAFTPDKR